MLKFIKKIFEKKHTNARLFIIGNGFDRAHDFHTSYADFRNWCKDVLSNTNYIEDEIPSIPFSKIGPKGDIIYNDEERMKLLVWLFSYESRLRNDPEWKEFEEYLHDLDLQTILNEETILIHADLEHDHHDNELSHEVQDMEMYASELRSCILTIKDIFSSWIKNVDIHGNRLSFGTNIVLDNNGVCRKQDLFFTFNYTETLEKIYNIPESQICHIHGYRRDGSELIIGHGDDTACNFNNRITTAADILEDTIRNLRKETYYNINKNYEFWNKLRAYNVNEVYSFGFSYGDVDLPYVQKIISCINNDDSCVWNLNSFDDKEEKNLHFESIIKKCGFRGKFGRYST